MAQRLEPDASELLAKALDLAVGGVSLARYAAGHTADKRLQRTFRHLASSGEHQAQLLRERLAEVSLPADEDGAVGGRNWWLIAGTAAAITTTVAAATAVVVYRLLTAPPEDPVRRAADWALDRISGDADTFQPSPPSVQP